MANYEDALGMWIFAIFGKEHCLLFFRAPDLAYLEEQEGSIGFINVLLPWGWGEMLDLTTSSPTVALVHARRLKLQRDCRPSLPPSLPSTPMGTLRGWAYS